MKKERADSKQYPIEILMNSSLHQMLLLDEEEGGFDWKTILDKAREEHKPNPLFSMKDFYETSTYLKSI